MNGCNRYPLCVNKDDTMQSIMIKFNELLICQERVINICFGKDISSIIKKYLPEIDFYSYNKRYNTINNSIYYHKSIFNTVESIDFNTNSFKIYREKIGFRRVRISNDKKLLDFWNEVSEEDRIDVNLRIRKNLAGVYFADDIHSY